MRRRTVPWPPPAAPQGTASPSLLRQNFWRAPWQERFSHSCRYFLLLISCKFPPLDFLILPFFPFNLDLLSSMAIFMIFSYPFIVGSRNRDLLLFMGNLKKKRLIYANFICNEKGELLRNSCWNTTTLRAISYTAKKQACARFFHLFSLNVIS